MLDHISLRVQDHSRAVAFYRAALAPLGYQVMMEYPGATGLGAGMPDFWVMATDQPLNPTHLAFSADRGAVDAFHAAALAAGGTDNGTPGLRLDYHPHYYAAFVRDPEGNNVEVVCHADPDAKPAPVKASARKASAKAATKAMTKAMTKKSARKAKPKAKAKAKAKANAKKKAPANKKRR
ncbi:MAG TPA: VOC family protein [Polyangia bacterium]|jgi:catechol 2,3-dioxygenase-like lactoylglutathione lyase family enzyme|nr:VOC family protein [Polyangia bacterium]